MEAQVLEARPGPRAALDFLADVLAGLPEHRSVLLTDPASAPWLVRVALAAGSRGIGRATALGLAAMGAHLAITARDRGRTEEAAHEIRTAGSGHVDILVADLSSGARAYVVTRIRGRLR